MALKVPAPEAREPAEPVLPLNQRGGGRLWRSPSLRGARGATGRHTVRPSAPFVRAFSPRVAAADAGLRAPASPRAVKSRRRSHRLPPRRRLRWGRLGSRSRHRPSPPAVPPRQPKCPGLTAASQALRACSSTLSPGPAGRAATCSAVTSPPPQAAVGLPARPKAGSPGSPPRPPPPPTPPPPLV